MTNERGQVPDEGPMKTDFQVAQVSAHGAERTLIDRDESILLEVIFPAVFELWEPHSRPPLCVKRDRLLIPSILASNLTILPLGVCRGW